MITERLQGILELVTDETVADIGCDHAYIPIRLAREGKITKAIATDVRDGPIKIAENNILKYHLSDIIEVRKGDGLSPLGVGEVECIIISGMGGTLILEIIKNNIDIARASTLILQPMNDQEELRKGLISLGFKIVKEELKCEGFKVYNLLKVVCGDDEEREEIFYHVPKELVGHPLFPMLAAKKRREFTKIMTGYINCSEDRSEGIAKYKGLLEELSKIESGLK